MNAKRGVLCCCLLLVAACSGPERVRQHTPDARPAPSEQTLPDRPADPRLAERGYPIYDSGYVDQPYVVRYQDGTWLVVFTTGSGREGEGGQHLVAATSTDRGRTWSVPVDVEPAGGPEASWGQPYLTSYGRLYVFYTYNGDRIDALDGRPVRADMLGWYCFRYSDDRGRTWSKRYRLPLPPSAVDLGNDWQGRVQLFWGIDEPVDVDGGMMFGFTRLGRYMLEQGEGWFFRCDNINTERDPERLAWVLLPEGGHGLRHPAFGSVQEEFNLVQMNDGALYVVYRTRTGHPAESYSRDGGKTWSLPDYVRYADGRPIKTPRACPRVWKTQEGRYLLWFHNHSGDSFDDRNPAWLAGGIERDGRILWSEPEIVLYSPDTSYASGRFSYPDLIQDDGRYWITATNKVRGRVHALETSLVEGLWRQFEDPVPTREGLVAELAGDSLRRPAVTPGSLPALDTRQEGGGLTLDIRLAPGSLSPGQVLLDTRGPIGEGLYLATAGYRQVELGLCTAARCVTWTTDPGLLSVVGPHHVTAIVDNGPGLILFVVDGKLCDGGPSRRYGWRRYDRSLGRIQGQAEAKIAPGRLLALRVYDRALRVSEAVGNHRAEAGRTGPDETPREPSQRK